VVKAAGSREVFLCGFINLNQVVEAVLATEAPFPLTLLCAGSQSRFAIEDAVCGGLFIHRLRTRVEVNIQLNDAARAAILLARDLGDDIKSLLYGSDNGRCLVEIGMEGDLPVCAADSILPVVPTLRDGKLVVLE